MDLGDLTVSKPTPVCDTQGVSSRPVIATFTFLDSMAQISVFLNCHSSYPMELMDSRGGSKNS